MRHATYVTVVHPQPCALLCSVKIWKFTHLKFHK